MLRKLSAYRIGANKYRITSLLNVKKESPTVKTFTFKDKQCAKAKPGQFLMLWIPGVDEIPLSILDANGINRVFVAVKRIGEATKALHKLGANELIGLRGPFGNSFTLKKGRILIVGGGTGLVPLLFLAKKLAMEKSKIVFTIGAKTKNELLFKETFEEICGKQNLIVTTEDGSCGDKGLATMHLERILAQEKFDMIYTCGPEKMMRKVLDLAEKYSVPMEASLERLMRCAIGLCGSCVIGKYRVCKDGPVFAASQLRQVKAEFGVSKRDFDGKLIPLE